MATLKDQEMEVREMATFYVDLSESAKSNGDRFYAALGRKSSTNILALAQKYHSDPKNSYLKRIHASLMTLIRGVENFQDKDAQKKHDSYGPLVTKLLQYVNENVKW
jgi:hypothetical protein